MKPEEKRDAPPAWRRRPGSKFLFAQWRRLCVGVIIGSIIAAVDHLLVHDAHFECVLGREWGKFSTGKFFDGVQTYRLEIFVLCAGIFLIVIKPAASWIQRWLRAWWAGITNAMTLVAACAVLLAITNSASHPRTSIATGLVLILATGATELWRRQYKEPKWAEIPKLKIDVARSDAPAEERWKARTSDDPINDWSEDIIGRSSVIERIATHIFCRRTPIVALNGGLGDGKTSVLNLLRKAVEDQAIVVPFSAWLPGSEATLASDLFRDIASECEKHIHVPHLRRIASA
jgi:hypothetical protein